MTMTKLEETTGLALLTIPVTTTLVPTIGLLQVMKKEPSTGASSLGFFMVIGVTGFIGWHLGYALANKISNKLHSYFSTN